MTWSDGSPVIDSTELDLDAACPIPGDLETPQAAAPLELETTGITRDAPEGRLRESELWKAATIHKLSVVAKLREQGEHLDADTLEDCHSRVLYAQCQGCRTVRLFRNRCDNFFCPECQPSMARRRAESVRWWTKQVAQPKHVVLTVRNVPDLTKGHVIELKKWFSRLRQRKFCANWKGGFYSVECTNEGKGWHLHLHILVDARWVDASNLARQWADVTNGAGYIVKVKDCRGEAYLKEVTKYACKGSDLAAWRPDEIVSFVAAFRGTRTFGVFGSLYGKRTQWKEWLDSLKDGLTKCPCGSNHTRYYNQQEWDAEGCKAGAPLLSRPPPEDCQAEFGAVMAATRSLTGAWRH